MKNKILPSLCILLSACTPSTDPLTDPFLNSAAPTSPTTSSAPLPIASPAGNGTVDEFKLSCEESRFVSLLNLYRKKFNLNELEVSKSGVESARWHAQDMINKNYFSHTEPDGRTFSERAAAFGYSAWSENIAAGNTSAQATFCQWKNSSGHNTNMLRDKHLSIGIGNVTGGGMYRSYWTNNFGPAETDHLPSPLNLDANCTQPAILPSC